MIRALGLLAALALTTGAQAQDRPHTVCRLPVLDTVGTAERAGKARALVPCAAPSAQFEVDYDGFSPQAERAFAAAVETWSCRIASDVPIRIDARWTELAGSVLGSAGPFLTRNFPGAPVRNTWYASALADAVTGQDLEGGFDIQAEFNSTFGNWHFDPETAPAPDEYDLYTVVLHELAHGLGFIGGLRVVDGVGRVGNANGADGPFIYDRFTRDGSGAPLLTLPAPSTVLADALTDAVRFDGPTTTATLGAPAVLYAPDRWQEGGSYSHFAESAFARGTPDGLMTPFIGRGEAIGVPGPAVCALLSDLGWPLGADCDGVGPVEPVASGVTLRSRGVNPVRRDLRLRLETAVPVTARVTLVDAVGRRVAELFSGVVRPGEPADIAFDARTVAQGSYLAVVEAEGAMQALGVTVVR